LPAHRQIPDTLREEDLNLSAADAPLGTVVRLLAESDGFGSAPGMAGAMQRTCATLAAIPDFVYAFDRQRRFVYANSAMLGLFGLEAHQILGKSFSDLGYPAELAVRLNRHLDTILQNGVTVEDEVFFDAPTGRSAYIAFLWGPVRAADGTVELVVGVSRDISERRAIEEELRTSEARLRAATELAGLGIYSWDPNTGELVWDDRLRAMWGLQPCVQVDEEVFQSGIHPDDLPRVRRAIEKCVDTAGDGRYDVEYRVVGRDDGVMRHIATSGQTTFDGGRATSFIGAAVDVTASRRAEAAIRSSEALFRSFAENSSNLIWIADPLEGNVIYRSAAYERMFGVEGTDAPTDFTEWMSVVHPDDRKQVEHALQTLISGEVVHFEYRIVRPSDGAVRYLRETGFPILDEMGAPRRIGGITEDLTREEVRQVYIVGSRAAEARRIARIVRADDCRARIFESGTSFLDVAAVLSPGCVLVDLRKATSQGLAVVRELKAQSLMLPTIALDGPSAGVDAAVAAMKAGAVDYIVVTDEAELCVDLPVSIAATLGAVRPFSRDDAVSARLAALTPREREVLGGLIDGGTNKAIAIKLGISPRTVEMHRSQLMSRLNARNLTELLQMALAAGFGSPAGAPRRPPSAF
jgi:PAS domain S-box-containing protein